jgi:16S rRNA (uracil1498-N3)-methyltransferase
MVLDPHPGPAADMPVQRPKVRLYVDHPLGQGQQVPLKPEAAHYLFNVMRLGAGDRVALFDGRSGEWAAELAPAGKRGGSALCLAPTAPQRDPPDLWLVFAPLKKARMDMVVEKAVELGAARLVPVATDYTNAERMRRDRIEAQLIEAAEQCGATHVPALDDLRPLSAVLAAWPAGRALVWADEGLAGGAASAAALPPPPAAVLVGPEGGFSAAERARIGALPFVHPLRLGPRILRAETAALASLALWQAGAGDWR